MTQEKIQEQVFAFLNRKYVQRADARHKAMGLQYTEAETHDLAKEMSKLFMQIYLNAMTEEND